MLFRKSIDDIVINKQDDNHKNPKNVIMNDQKKTMNSISKNELHCKLWYITFVRCQRHKPQL